MLVLGVFKGVLVDFVVVIVIIGGFVVVILGILVSVV